MLRKDLACVRFSRLLGRTGLILWGKHVDLPPLSPVPLWASRAFYGLLVTANRSPRLSTTLNCRHESFQLYRVKDAVSFPPSNPSFLLLTLRLLLSEPLPLAPIYFSTSRLPRHISPPTQQLAEASLKQLKPPTYTIATITMSDTTHTPEGTRAPHRSNVVIAGL